MIDKRLQPPVIWLLPLSLSILCGMFVIGGDFVLDDRRCILSNHIVTENLPACEAFLHDFCGTPLSESEQVLVWRPVMPIIWKYIWKFSNGAPIAFRGLTPILHYLATFFVLMVSRATLKHKAAVLITGVLFSVHPIHSETLGSIVSQADILSTVFGLSAVWIALQIRNSVPAMILIGFLLLMSCLVKESGIVFAMIVFIIPWLKEHRPKKEIAIVSIPAVTIAIGIIMLQLVIERGGQNPINCLTYCATGIERTLHGLYIIGRSISMSFIPYKLSFSHDYAAVDLSLATLLPFAVAAILMLVLCVALVFRAIETRNVGWIIGIALLTGPAVIQSGLIVAVNTEIAERLMYMSSAASCAIIASLIVAVIKDNRLIVAATTILTVVFIFQSYHVGRAWISNRNLFEFAVKSEPLSWRAHNNHANILLYDGKTNEAIWHYMVAAYILSNRPRTVDPSPIEKLQRLELDERLTQGPAFFSSENPAKFVKFFYEQLIVLFHFPGAIELLSPRYVRWYDTN